ncbi:MAG: OsmC family protein [Gaiellaceae bacterium]
MGILKSHRFPVQAHWFGGRLLRLGAPEKPRLKVATPPEFEDGIEGIWSPEELLVGALAACYELTLAAVAERRAVPIHTIDVAAVGHLERASGGGFGFTVIELDVDLTTDPGRESEAQELALLVKRQCIVARAMEVPLRVQVEARSLAGEAAPV